MPLEHLLRWIRDGEICAKQEDGFTFVDLALDGPQVRRPATPPHLRPPTFVAAVEDEPSAPPPHQPDSEPEEGFEDETASKQLGDWRAARRKASKLRIPPPRQRPHN
jgi:hypothetical protein